MIARRTLFDFVLSPFLLYLSVWLYEGGNYLALLLGGQHVSLVMAGALPAGVVAIGQSALPGVAKVLQVAMTVGAVAPLYLLARRTALAFTFVALACVVAFYLSSFYWELLSLVGPLPLVLHEGVFALLSLGGLALFMKADPKLRGLLW